MPLYKGATSTWQCAIENVDHRWGSQVFGPARPARPPPPHFYRQGPAPNPSLLSTGPGPQALTFIDRAWPPNPSLLSTGPGPQPLTFIDRAWPPTPQFYRQGPAPNPSLLLATPSLLLARPPTSMATPLTSISRTPHFYWPDPSLLLILTPH